MRFNLKYWLSIDNEHLIGKGGVELLANIKKTGSLAAAARLMNMSYRKAWNMIDTMNRKLKKPVANKTSGGVSGGHTELTLIGEQLLELNVKLDNEVRDFVLRIEHEYFK